MNPPPTTALHAQITTSLLHKYSLPISPTFLTTFLSSQRQPPPPTPSLISTLHFRLLASDITLSLSSANTSLPLDIAAPTTKERHLTTPSGIPCQILDVQDIGSSAYAQVETLEMIERGEMIKGREIVRTVDVEGEANDHADASAAAPGPANRSTGPFKFTLQDARGTQVPAFTVSPIPKLGIPMPGDEASGMSIGCKVVLKAGTVVRRGVVMMQTQDVVVLGGKVDAWDRRWREGRKERLLAKMAEGVA